MKKTFHGARPEASFRLILSFKQLNENADASHEKLCMIQKATSMASVVLKDTFLIVVI